MTKSKIQNKSKIPIPKQNLWPFGICALCLFWILCFGICHFALAQDKIIAIVNNEVITQKDLDDFIHFARLQLSSELNGEVLEEKLASMKEDFLEKLIEDRVILQEAKKAELKISAGQIQPRMEQIRARYDSDAEFQEALAQQGLVPADLEKRIEEQLLMYTIVEKEVRSKILVNPAEVTDYYQKNKERFVLAEQREFETINIRDSQSAEEICQLLKKGEKIEDITEKYSLTANKLTAFQGELKQEIEQAVFGLKPEEFCAPTKIGDEWYIFKVYSITPSRQQNLSEVQEGVCSLLYNEKMRQAMSKWLQGLKDNSFIKICAP